MESQNCSEYYPHFINNEIGIIGRTVSTKHEPNTSGKFYFWISSRNDIQGTLEIGNIVVARSDDNSDLTFGQIAEMRSYSDVDNFIADFLSHDFGNAEIQVPTDIAEIVIVSCNVMRSVAGKTKPVGRSRVYFPSSMGIEFAYGIIDDKGECIYAGAPIPIGIFENGDGTRARISVDEDFIIGPEGAHLNVSGISGLASKTSSILFILKSLLTFTRKKVAIVMFNVKSKDLLYIDQPNARLAEDTWSERVYDVLHIERTPFAKARFFAPVDPDHPAKTKSMRKLPTNSFSWDLHMIFRDIPSLFDPMDWDDKMEGVWFVIREKIEQGEWVTYAQMLTGLDRMLQNPPANNYIRGNHVATWYKMRSHLTRFPRAYSGLISTAGSGSDIPWTDLNSGSVYIIDMQMLNDRGQRLVFGRTMRAIASLLENRQTDLNSVIVFVDEFNKFAPSGSARTPLKSSLIEITARGRSLGMVLFGAEQFASSVDKEIVENSSTHLFGRTESNELRTPSYSVFSDEIKTKLTMLPQGQLLAKFAKFPQPIFVKFPYPTCLPGNLFTQSE